MIPANLPKGLASKWNSLKHNSSKRIWHWVPIPYDKLSLEDSVNRLEWQLRVDHVPARTHDTFIILDPYVEKKLVLISINFTLQAGHSCLKKMARYVFPVWFLLTSTVKNVLWKIPATSCLSLLAPATSYLTHMRVYKIVHIYIYWYYISYI